MINISIRCLVLNSESISLFDIGRVGSRNRIAVHVKVVDSDLCRCIGDILKSDHIVLKSKQQFL